MTRAWHIAAKDIRIWLRDVSALGILLGMPVVLILILGSALGGGGGEPAIKVAVVDLSDGATPAGATRTPSDELAEGLAGSKQLAEYFDVQVVPTEKAANELVAKGDAAAALIIPASFDDDVANAKPTALRVVKDPGSEMAAGIWESVVTGYASSFSAASVSVQTVLEVARRENPAIMADPAAVGRLTAMAVAPATVEGALSQVAVEDTAADTGTELTALDFFGLSMTSMFLMFGAMFGAFATIRERREQTLSRLLATPTSGMAVTAGKMLGIFALGMLQFSVLFLFTRFVFQVNWGVDILAVFVVAAAEVLAVTGLAVLIASLARSERGAGGLGPLVIQIQALIGGAFFTITVLPEWLQPIQYFSVIGWTMSAWGDIQQRGAHLGDVLVPIAALLGFAAVFFAFGAWMTGRRA